jgi:type II secretory pathway component PulM
MKLFKDTEGIEQTFLQMIWNKKLPWYENLLIWAGALLIFVSFYSLIFLAMLIGG